MERHVVIGTAGHIDHGKTALVKALTGVDTDRLAEEKERGITIDLGFAPLQLGDIAASVVDVPGHEGFVRNMVSGATGVDLALLVVACDEGVMPQTREHLAILRYLAVDRGVVALTKKDLAPDESWRMLVADDVRSALRDHGLGPWRMVEVSAVSGEGLDELREALSVSARAAVERDASDRFRMPIDRVFSLPGAGTIITGTVWSGSVAEGHAITLLPAGREVRIRSVQVHGKPAPEAAPGRRAALAVLGVDKADVARGAVAVAGRGWRTSRSCDVVLEAVGGHEFRSRQRLRVHHGTAEVMARIGRITEGGFARLALESPLVLRAGDRLVLRSYSPVTTIGGAVVTEPWADDPSLPRRRQPAPRARSDGELVVAMVRRRGAHGMSRTDLEVASGLSAARLEPVVAAAQSRQLVVAGDHLYFAEEVAAAAMRMQHALEAWLAANPLEPGMNAQAWRASLGEHRDLAILAEERLIASGAVVRSAGVVRPPDWNPAAATAVRDQAAKVLAHLAAAGPEPPSVPELAAAFPGTDVPAVLRMLAREGRVVQVGPDRYYEAGVLDEQRRSLESVLAELGEATAATLRERLGLTRKWLIPFLEWADREGVTVRNGDLRRLRTPKT